MKNLHFLLLLMVLLAACGGAEPTTLPTDEPAAAETAVAAPTSTVADAETDDDDTDFHAHTLDVGLFFDGALEGDVAIQDCTLADGTATTCYAITIAGYPANYDVGPFCPETTADTADEGGIWFDGDGVYDLDGAFILGLADLYNDSNWKLYDDDGNVNVTDTEEAFEAAARPDVDPAYQNHCVEGRIEWLDNGEPVPTTVLIPTTPVVGASATQANGNLGITLNGVIIAAPAPVQAILSAYTIAAFDDCGGHINPVDGYHLHGARGCSDVGETVAGETPIFAYALDGYAIHSPLAEADEAAAGLDACQGHTTAADGYHYHAASVEDNAILSCFTGVTVESTGRGGGGAPPQGDGRLFTIPGDNVFPEGVSYDEASGKFYVGATSDGTLYVGDVNGDLAMTVFSEGGADGRTAAVGTKVDSDGRLWVAGGATGQVFVYDTADGSFIAAITSDLFGYPTTIAYSGNSFLVANSQFNNRSAPNLPFTVAQIPLAQSD